MPLQAMCGRNSRRRQTILGAQCPTMVTPASCCHGCRRHKQARIASLRLFGCKDVALQQIRGVEVSLALYVSAAMTPHTSGTTLDAQVQ
jgi:hypothetical protein